MIKSKPDLKEYLEKDKIQLGIKRLKPRPFLDDIWKYEIELRKYEYYLNSNSKSLIKKITQIIYKFKHKRRGIRLGITIPPNTCGKGLSIAHHSCIQINKNAKIGENLRIHEGVTIGASGGDAPFIGNNVFLGSGCKVMGKVTIADGVVVGANSVVVKDIIEPNITVAGAPAKKVSDKNSDGFVFWYKSGE